jgi:hypothetical protein
MVYGNTGTSVGDKDMLGELRFGANVDFEAESVGAYVGRVGKFVGVSVFGSTFASVGAHVGVGVGKAVGS